MPNHNTYRVAARAATISDITVRESFLHNVPHHREIVAVWTALGPGFSRPCRRGAQRDPWTLSRVGRGAGKHRQFEG
jgi:hypothetical protein